MNTSDDSAHVEAAGERRGFTVIELLVVLVVIVLLASVLTRASLGSQRSAALHSAPALVAGQFALARAKAMSLGETTRVLVHIDSASTAEPSRFLRHLVVQVPVGGQWVTISEAYLPEGVYVVPGNFTGLPAGLFGEIEAAWVRIKRSELLRSTVLRSDRLGSYQVQSEQPEQWARVEFASPGTTFQAGDLVLASGRPRAPGTYAAGESPVQFDGPETVCGFSLSKYGAVVFIHDRASF